MKNLDNNFISCMHAVRARVIVLVLILQLVVEEEWVVKPGFHFSSNVSCYWNRQSRFSTDLVDCMYTRCNMSTWLAKPRLPNTILMLTLTLATCIQNAHGFIICVCHSLWTMSCSVSTKDGAVLLVCCRGSGVPAWRCWQVPMPSSAVCGTWWSGLLMWCRGSGVPAWRCWQVPMPSSAVCGTWWSGLCFSCSCLSSSV